MSSGQCRPAGTIECGSGYCDPGVLCHNGGCITSDRPPPAPSPAPVTTRVEQIGTANALDPNQPRRHSHAQRFISTYFVEVTNREALAILCLILFVSALIAGISMRLHRLVKERRAYRPPTASRYADQLLPGEIVVRMRLTGQIGAIREHEFDPNIYERVA